MWWDKGYKDKRMYPEDAAWHYALQSVVNVFFLLCCALACGAWYRYFFSNIALCRRECCFALFDQLSSFPCLICEACMNSDAVEGVRKLLPLFIWLYCHRALTEPAKIHLDRASGYPQLSVSHMVHVGHMTDTCEAPVACV